MTTKVEKLYQEIDVNTRISLVEGRRNTQLQNLYNQHLNALETGEPNEAYAQEQARLQGVIETLQSELDALYAEKRAAEQTPPTS